MTNAFSKKLYNHACHVSLYCVYYNFCRPHRTLRMTPAMAARIEPAMRDAEWIVGLVDAAAPEPERPGPKPGSHRKST